jgi:CDGSH-type Zn-finger protein
MPKGKIVISKNGPYMVSGKIPLRKEIIKTDSERYPLSWEKGETYPEREKYDLCRCGQSKNKPFCDRTHIRTGFDGQEVASHRKYLDEAEIITGPELDLTDVYSLCSGAGFCDRDKGTWELTKNSNQATAKKNGD